MLARRPFMDLRHDPRLPGPLAAGPVEIHEVPGTHGTFLTEPHVRVLARKLRACIARAITPVRVTHTIQPRTDEGIRVSPVPMPSRSTQAASDVEAG